MLTKQTNLLLFDELITTHALPTYTHMGYGRIAYLFAHVHALRDLNIITENYIHQNFSEFCRHIELITNDIPLPRSKAHQRHYNPTNKQLLLTEEITQKYKLILFHPDLS